MKKQFTIFATIFVAVVMTTQATIWTVSNNPDSPGQYTELQTAIDNASPGDTILVSGSTSTYGNISITKQIVLIGTGYDPINQFGFHSECYNVTLVKNASEDASGTVIMGFEINELASNIDVNNILLERNYTDDISIGGNNWIIKSNHLKGRVYINNHSDIYISNNLSWDGLFNSTDQNVYVSNNVFYGVNSIHAFQHAIISNNIFTSIACPTYQCYYNTYNNNITFTGGTCDLPPPNNTGSGNLNNTDPQFISGTYHLSETSPGKNAGTDGTDIGIYGGAYPFIDGGIPPIPQILYMNVENIITPMNTDIDVHIIGKKQD